MLLRKPLLAIGVAVGFGALGIEIAACSSGSSTPPPNGQDSQAEAPPPPPGLTCTTGGLTIAFNPMYSAYDGKHIFQIPAIVVGSNASVTWGYDTSMVGMQPDSERPNQVLIQVLKAGKTTILAQSSDGKCGSSPLTITPAKESDWEIGKARYNDGTSLHLNAAAPGGDGSVLEPGHGMPGPACTNCHGETATNSQFTDVSHTPEQTGGFSDSDILNIVLRGTFPPGGYFDDTIVPYAVWQTWHKWADITADQQTGIIVYLRSLTPVPQRGAVNFNNLLVDAGSGSGDGMDAASESSGGMDAAPESSGGTDAAPESGGGTDAGSESGDAEDGPAGD